MSALDHLQPQLFMREEQARAALRLPYDFESGIHAEPYHYPIRAAGSKPEEQPSLDLRFDAPTGDQQAAPSQPRKSTAFGALSKAYFG